MASSGYDRIATLMSSRQGQDQVVQDQHVKDRDVQDQANQHFRMERSSQALPLH